VSAGMTNAIVCIWAKPGDIVSYIDQENWDRSGPVDIQLSEDNRKIIRVDQTMIAVEGRKTIDEWLIRPDIRTLVNCTHEVKRWKGQYV
jgi:hypothetical protein